MGSGRKDIYIEGKKTQFKPGYDEKRGKKPKNKFELFRKENNLSSSDIANIIKSMVDKTEDELNKLVNNKNESILLRHFASLFIDEFLNKKYKYTQDMINRAVGMPKQEIKNISEVVTYNVDIELTDEEKKAYDERIKEFTGKKD